MNDKSNFIYILQCSDNTLYTGWTNNLEDRIIAHNEGNGAKYTRVRLPVKIVYSETFPTKSEAMKREYEIKRMNRRQKLELINKGMLLVPKIEDDTPHKIIK